MAKGRAPVQERLQAAAEQQKRFAESSVPMLFSKEIRKGGPDGGPIIVRFLEQGEEINSYERHPFRKPGAMYPDHVTCLSEVNMDCPACRAGLKSTRKGAFNLIVRNRAVLRKGADGKAVKAADGSFIVDGYADQLVVWEHSNTTMGRMIRADDDYQGLMTRDFQLRLTGNDKDPYDVFPVDLQAGPVPMSQADLELAAKKFDLDKVFAPPTQDEMRDLVMKYGANSGASGPVASQMPSVAAPALVNNPYAASAQLPATAFPQQPAAPAPPPQPAQTPGQ